MTYHRGTLNECGGIQTQARAPQTRWTRMMSNYDGLAGLRTVEAALAQIPADLQRRLTGKELGMVMSAVNAAYHNGRASARADVINGDYVWVNALKRGYDLSALRAMPATR